jgi:hypothetical protein
MSPVIASAMPLQEKAVAAAVVLFIFRSAAVLARQNGAAVGAREKPVGLPFQSSCCVVTFGLLLTNSVSSCRTPAGHR